MRIALSLAMVLALSAAAHAGPFSRSRSVSRSTESACINGQCGEQVQVRQKTVVRTHGTSSSAQAAAEAMAADGVMRHFQRSSACYEGVGVGGSPEAALGSCCNNGGSVIDQGVAYGHGRWFACRRYTLR
jgi:3-oxoacyl-(acyl-carrier-protein) synthase